MELRVLILTILPSVGERLEQVGPYTRSDICHAVRREELGNESRGAG
jgi:hypothetical protein